MYFLYRALTNISAPVLSHILSRRLKSGKELAARYGEKKSIITRPRPDGTLVWLHAASVGEVQSALILIDRILTLYPRFHVLVTTGTVTSAALMEQKLPDRAFHQFYPLDHPAWVRRFLDHWRPDMALWMESELWPNMLHEIQARNIPAFLVNARMSDGSFKSWRYAGSLTRDMLGSFRTVLCQTNQDKVYYDRLGAEDSIVTDNLKYSAAALPCDMSDLKTLQGSIGTRPVWLYASTHSGEEEIASRIHTRLKTDFPDILTIIVPRHPERRDEINTGDLRSAYRGIDKTLPRADDDIYVADTLGELGLFYRLCPIAVIGRSFSDDGGGGHNPIEAAQLECVVLCGPHVHNLQDIYDDMLSSGGAVQTRTPDELYQMLHALLSNPKKMRALQNEAKDYSMRKISVIDKVMDILTSTFKSL